jgi:hypothetical protein
MPILVVFLFVAASPMSGRFAAAAENAALTFEQHVRPILKANCFQCHGEEEEIESSLDLRLQRLMVDGGDSGPAVVPGNSEESLLYTRIRDGEMPPGEKKLASASVEVIRRWIAEGAKTARPEPAEITEDLQITEDEKRFWSFQPVRNPVPPAVRGTDRLRTPIDAFIVARLQERNLSLAPDAKRVVLVRRAFFDLLGLPPTPADVLSFIEDDAPDAYERLIDRLLQSPHYGERWGRHWLDVAGYADSEGYTNEDRERPWAYQYRDYVIRAFNADVPMDRFIREQLAGDEMVVPPYKNLSSQDLDRVTATGFLRMAPDGTGSGGIDQDLARNKVLADTIKIVSTSLLGLSVGCAQCHNHRYDPITQTDYYRFRAIFEPAYDPHNWRTPVQRQVSLFTDGERDQVKQIDIEASTIRKRYRERSEEYVKIVFEVELGKLPEALRPAGREAWETPSGERTPEQIELFRVYPSLNVSAGEIYLYDPKAAEELKKIQAEIDRISDRKPAETFLRVLTESPGKIPETHVFNRGDHTQPKDAVVPGELKVLTREAVQVPINDSSLASTGRRLAYAHWLTSGQHPLTARVLVNRVWLHHFARGLVETPADFGMLGTPPTHPELLDWLASELVASSWSLKHLHRLIMTSSVYRQSSRYTAVGGAADPESRFYWRKPIRRLEAETLRDAILAVGGQLNRRMFGPPASVTINQVGQFVIGRGGDERAPVIELGDEAFRRSVYVQVRRSRPLSVLATFDAPRMEPNCAVRSSSTVTPQSLMLMNSTFVMRQSEFFAERLRKEVPGDEVEQIRRGWHLAFARLPAPEELADALAFVRKQTELFRTLTTKDGEGGDDGNKKQEQQPEFYGLASFCQSLMGANEFLYVD